MKTTLIISCFVFLGASTIEAQIIRNIGLNVGYVYAKQNWESNPQTGISYSYIDPISSISGGVFVEFLDIPNFSMVTKLLYVGKGRTISVRATWVDANDPSGYKDIGYQEIKQRLNYISFPLLVKLRLGIPLVDPFVAFGPRFEYLLSYPTSTVYDNFKKTEWTGTISAGTEITLIGFPKFCVEANYNTSLTDSYKSDMLTISDNSFEVLVGVSF